MKRDNREIVISGRNEINKIERFIEEICDYYNIYNEYFGNILLATTEAADILLSLHDSSESGHVLISFNRNSKGLVFNIKAEEYEGNPIEGEDILDQEIRRHKLSRDIYIIRALTDEITISVKARSIILVFYVSSMNYEKSLERITRLKEYWTQKDTVIHKK
jgi:hypothetical protein